MVFDPELEFTPQFYDPTADVILDLVSMWLDSLILRLMERQTTTAPVWFVVDELATLQRLPQLPTAVTQGRRANIRLVLGLQGRSQLEPSTEGKPKRCFLSLWRRCFSAPVSRVQRIGSARSIGEIEIMRLEARQRAPRALYSTISPGPTRMAEAGIFTLSMSLA